MNYGGHQKAKRKGKGQWEVLVDWDYCNSTWEPLSEMEVCDLIIFAKYTHENNLTTTNGCKWSKKAKVDVKKYIRLAKILRFQVKHLKARYKFGVNIPRSAEECAREDKKNGNTLWTDALNKEKERLFDYKTFNVLDRGVKAPRGYKRIPGFFMFDVKHDIRRKARFVAGGHMSIKLKEDSYSGVVEHESVRLVLFLAIHNDLEEQAADIGNTYLHATTREKVFIVAGPEFGPELEGRVMLIVKSLYGLTTSAACWHEELSTSLRSLRFKPSYVDQDV